MKTYTIKPLEWKHLLYPGEAWGADSALGKYQVYTLSDSSEVELSSPSITGRSYNLYPDIPQAKAAAEAHYIEQMEKGLQDAPAHD